MVLHSDNGFVIVAFALHTSAFIIWATLKKYVDKYVFWAIIVWMFLIGLRQVLLVADKISAAKTVGLLIAILALYSTILVRRLLTRYREISDENVSLATGLAQLTQKYKTKISFYEEQAKANGLTVLPTTQKLPAHGRIKLPVGATHHAG